LRLLLDTHAFLWMIQDPARLSDTARAALSRGDNELMLSVASCWEMAIKHAAGRLQFPGPFAQFIESQSAANRIDLLPISMAHLDSLVALPKPGGDHRDPFDRLLIAQALAERIPLVSGDGAMDAYGVARPW
jgi:PIN domain nuclease of toxin-antitoxin system